MGKWVDPPWFIAIVTFAYTVISFFTLLVIWRQNRSIQNTERAVLVPVWDNFVHLNPETVNKRLSHCFLVKFSNCGRTPAFIREHHATMMLLHRIEDLPKRPKYGKGVLFQGDPVIPGATTESEFYSPLADPRTFEEIDAEIRTGKQVLYVIGYVRYNDVFGRTHETRYGLRYRAAPQAQKDYDGFLVDGPNRYNRYL